MTNRSVFDSVGLRRRAGQAAALCGIAAVLAACEPATQASAPASGPVLTQEQLLATFPGRTASGISNSDNATPWSQTYSAEPGATRGTIRGSFGGSPYPATWAVDGSQWCEDWITDSVCYTFQQAGPQTLRALEDGQPLPNLWTID